MMKNASAGTIDYHMPNSLKKLPNPKYESENDPMGLYYGFHEDRFGKYLLALTGVGEIVALDFYEHEHTSLTNLQNRWPGSDLIQRQEKTDQIAFRLFQPATDEPFRILVRGTPFQLKVWECLTEIPFGRTVSYQWVANKAGNPKGSQAVGNAMGDNPVAFLIPCHRVVTKDGHISGYRWGVRRKAEILDWEQSLTGQQPRLF
jgi:AraC family transcriptional regulator of adaptative response/methylated-DNA-[protein]-cysteine methyltransferase